MSRLRLPLRQQLEDPADEAALQRMAQRIDSRLQPRARTSPIRFVLGGIATLGIGIAVVALLHRDAGPLVLADGKEFAAVEAKGSTKELSLSDGSHIRLSSGARIEPLESSSTSFAAIVTRGSAEFDVRPGGPRRWVIECGLAAVEVVGTEFTCEREPGQLRVAVRRGVVLVRGERVPQRAQRLNAGETLDIAETPARAAAAGTGSAVAAAATASTDAAPLNAPVPGSGHEPRADGGSARRDAGERSWQDLARHGRHREAFAALGTEGVRREVRILGVNELLSLADVARLSGHPAEAVRPLERILNEFASDAQAPLAAFALGRLQLDSLGNARAAASAFRQALTLGIPQSLREDARARLVEACARSGDSAGAQSAANAYFKEFPDGRRARAVRGWLTQR